MSAAKELAVLYTGRVQGVGFRFTALDVAGRCRLRGGYVQNLPDGSVRLVAQGSEAELLKLLAGIRASPVGRFVVQEMVDWREPTESFGCFTIRH